MAKKVRVLIVDDSALSRQVLKDLLGQDSDIIVQAAVTDPFAAVRKIAEECPDVIILDIKMPKMDGLTFLQKIMSQHPIPVIICSSLIEEQPELGSRALEYGAVEIILKPKVGTREFLEKSREQICRAVKSAAQIVPKPQIVNRVNPKLSADIILPPPAVRTRFPETSKIIVAGASTGGTIALTEFLKGFPPDCPGIVVVQHMPEKFTSSFASRLNSCCEIAVKEAVDGDSVDPGQAIIAEGNRHLLLRRSGSRYYVEIKSGPLISRHRPSVDVLFRSAALSAGPNGIGVILTGMGDDGAQGMLEMKQAGAFTIAQDEQSSVVFGMPAEAIRLGGTCQVLTLKKIAPVIIDFYTQESKK